MCRWPCSSPPEPSRERPLDKAAPTPQTQRDSAPCLQEPFEGGSVFVLNKLDLSLPKRFIPGKNGEFVFKPDHHGADLERTSEACGEGRTMSGRGVLPTTLRGGGVLGGSILPAVFAQSVL